MRWPVEKLAGPPVLGKLQTWTSAEIGDEAIATVRCVVPIPGGVALGSDYGLTLHQNGRFFPFPWPLGARREARRVEAMTVHAGKLYVGTSQSLFVWDFQEPATWTRHGRDQEDGWDDICALHSENGNLYQGFRTKFYGGEGPPDVLCMTTGPAAKVYAGTREGELWIIDEGGPLRVFADRRYDGRMKGRPIRHIAYAEGALHLAVQGAHWRFDGEGWSSSQPEPTAFTVDTAGRLWALGEGKLWRLQGQKLQPIPVSLERPWSLAATEDALWIGGRERVWRLPISSLR